MQGYDNPVVRGIMTGLAIRQSLENSARQKTMLEDAQRKMDLEDIQNRMMLEQVSRPITNGAVSESLPVPGGITPGLDVSGISFDVARKPDASRTVKYKTRAGETITRELMTPDEQLQKKIRDAAQMDEARTQSQISAEQLMRERMGVRLPGFENIPLLPKEASTVMDNMVRESAVNARSAADRASRESMAEEARKSRESIAEQNRKAQAARTAEANATRLKAANIAHSGEKKPAPLNPITVTKTLHDLESDEANLWRQHSTLKESISQGTYTDPKGNVYDLNAKKVILPNGDEKDLNDLQVKSLKNRMNGMVQEAQKRILDTVKAKNKVIRDAGGTVSVSEQDVAKQLQGGAQQKGRIRVKLSDGRTGTIDASEFDAKTMTKL